MAFTEPEKIKMRALKGVGDTVISRLEQMGYSSLSQLVDEDPLFITQQISKMMGSTCWHNSPQARGAISAIVAMAVHEASQSN